MVRSPAYSLVMLAHRIDEIDMSENSSRRMGYSDLQMQERRGIKNFGEDGKGEKKETFVCFEQ